MFALESLSLDGETYENSEAVKRACDFLVSKQRKDGGWGESWEVSYLILFLPPLFFSTTDTNPESVH